MAILYIFLGGPLDGHVEARPRPSGSCDVVEVRVTQVFAHTYISEDTVTDESEEVRLVHVDVCRIEDLETLYGN